MAADTKVFLQEVLGANGAEALLKATRRQPQLAQVLVPRAIIGWAAGAAAYGYQGPLPGVDSSRVEFRKSEQTGLFSGALTVGAETLPFVDASIYRVAAVLAQALGTEPEPVPQLRRLDLERLGKSIDLLVRTHLLKAEPRVLSRHGDLEVVNTGVGPTPFTIRHSDGRPCIDRIATAADAQRLAHLQGVVRQNLLGKFEDQLEKRRLDPGLGYSLSHEHHDLGGGEVLTHVRAHDSHGAEVGAALFSHSGDKLIPEGVLVQPLHQRLGLASALYSHAEKLTGKVMAPSHDQTPNGKALWGGNAGSQFGKVEAPGGLARPQPQQGPQGPIPAQKQAHLQAPKQIGAGTKGPGVKAPPRTQEKVPGLKGAPEVKLPQLRVAKSEAGTRCSICAEPQFQQGGFSGCLCFRALAPAAICRDDGDHYVLTLGSEWGNDALEALAEALHPQS